MGVPAFFRWLSCKYPSIVVSCIEEKKRIGDVEIPVNCCEPNPHGIEFDNFYLDMNGIIHPCCHPENKPAPANEDEMMVAIFEYIDRLFNIIRPRRLLYMAIDGVAPRAKMNQQRSRRFRASKEAEEKEILIKTRRQEMELQGIPLPPVDENAEHFDSNCITPGTPFMSRLAECLRYYINDRLSSNPAWKDVAVILSDASVPGEGEHKIMDFIRRQRASPSYDPNLQHVICGADADLIMLGLATHEPNFTIIREEFIPNRPRPCEICHGYGKIMRRFIGLDCSYCLVNYQMPLMDTTFIFIRLSILREYLKRDLQIPNLPFQYDFEVWLALLTIGFSCITFRFVFSNFSEGAIDRLIKLYKECVYKTGGYLTKHGYLNLARVQVILNGRIVSIAFSGCIVRLQNRARRVKSRRLRERARMVPAYIPTNSFAPNVCSFFGLPEANFAGLSLQTLNHVFFRLWESGWKERYFLSKMQAGAEEPLFRSRVAFHYVEGLCWVLRYYYQGCASWNWFYPFHYSPFASDFVNIGDMKIVFPEDTKPTPPFEQLMSVFPPASRMHLPPSWGELMIKPNSPIIDFYPTDFKVDLNGKRFAWQGVALLPFVDAQRLKETLVSVYPDLSAEERKRNSEGNDVLFVSSGHQVHSFIKTFQYYYAYSCLMLNPQYPKGFLFPSKMLDGAKEPLCVLKPQDWNEKTDGRFWPTIGFTRGARRVSLSAVGHRILANVMPPPSRNVQYERESYNAVGRHIFPAYGNYAGTPYPHRQPYQREQQQQQQQRSPYGYQPQYSSAPHSGSSQHEKRQSDPRFYGRHSSRNNDHQDKSRRR
ncbi:5' 3' exoribonuclease 2 [Trichuris trichiura]|uniref:5'-3' exoribonuclease n=1 Tax=Trichuris trichiura TaxID=36087 RepID=A0A077Z408_TRITR|nr:5' 3' exoribonuclease 2 [Trichuris trichiura]